MSSFIAKAFKLLHSESPMSQVHYSPPHLQRFSDSSCSEIPKFTIQKFTPIKITRNIQKQKKLLEPLKGGCKCLKSKCEKSYCECFASGKPCGHECLCLTCKNVSQSYTKRIQQGCNCKKTGCQKRYCECYVKKKKCTFFCNCILCENCDGDDDSADESDKENKHVIGCLSDNMLKNEQLVRQLNQFM